jgi:flagellin-specific chaperone FliS
MSNTPQPSLHDLILENGWQQGAFANPADFLGSQDNDSAKIWIVVTQTCDLANPNLNNEPTVEFIEAQKITKIDSTYENLKNPRRLHIENNGQCYEILAQNRRFFPREKLQFYQSKENLTPKTLRILQDFMSRRYRRPEYADEFNSRRENKKVNREISKIIEDLHEYLEMILVGSNITEEKEKWSENPIEINKYIVDFLCILKPQKDEETVIEILEKLQNLFSEFDGIEANYVVMPIGDLTYEEYRSSVIWDTDAVSIADQEDESFV